MAQEGVTIAAPVQYEIDKETLRWQPPECFKCKKRKLTYTELSWPSKFAGEIICGDCQKKYFDPVLDMGE